MFANLKKKIQEENGKIERPGPGLASPVNKNAPQRAAVHGSPAASSAVSRNSVDQGSLKRADSVSSLGSSHESSPAPGNSKEEVLAMLIKRTEQVKKLESKISEYAATIKEKNKKVEKLELAMEKQTDASTKRTREINDHNQASQAKLSEGFTLALQKKEEEMTAFIKQVQKEKGEMEEKLTQAEAFKDKYYKHAEETDEFQGLASQELAKVKHLLLNKEEELTSCRKYLQDKMGSLETAVQTQSELEKELESKRTELGNISDGKNKTDQENVALREKVDRLQNSLMELTTNYEEKASRLVTVETSLNDLHHEHSKLERTSDVYKNKTVSLLEEKESHISHLEDRVKTLEQRLHDSELSGDEKTVALQAERTNLELKLSEARQQLTEIKSSWSEKINHLEQQIEHLNTKIVEDREEVLNSHKSAETTRESLQKQVESLRTSLEETSKRASSHLETIKEKEALLHKQCKEFEMEKARVTQHSMDSDTELRAKVEALESQLSQLQSLRDGEKQQADGRIQHLESLEAEYLQKEIDHEQTVSQLESNYQQRIGVLESDWKKRLDDIVEKEEKLTSELSRKERECSTTLKILEETRLEVTQLRDKVTTSDQAASGANQKMSSYEEKVQLLQTELQELTEEKDSLLLRNAELSQELTRAHHSGHETVSDLRAEVKRLSESVEDQSQTMEEKEEEIKLLQSQHKAIEHSHKETLSAAHSDEVQRYEQMNVDLEMQLTEKNKTIKMLQQRLGDLKKTLQRELKVQALPNDDQREPSRELEVARLSVSNSDSVDGLAHAQKHSTMARNSASQHLNVHMGASEGKFVNSEDMRDVNFEYLKHVVLKFMLSRETEAIHLIKAVSMLLDFTPDEEKLIKQTLEYRMSWFGRAPSLGKGQKTKAIPPNF